MHDVSPYSAWLHVHFLHRIGESVRPPPLHDLLGLGPCIPDQLARCIEDPGYHDLASSVSELRILDRFSRRRSRLCDQPSVMPILSIASRISTDSKRIRTVSL